MNPFCVCFIGGARYSRPLDTTSDKKFRLLAELGKLFVVGFSQTLRPHGFVQHAHFYLLPKFPTPILRYLEMCVIGLVLVLWLIWRHGVRILVAQSPYEGFTGVLAKKIAKLFGLKVVLVVECHGDFEESVFLQRRVLLPKLYRSLMRHIISLVIRNVDLLRAVSDSTKHQLERWTCEKLILQFPAWTDIEVFLQAGARDKKPLTQNILYAGVLIPGKGIHHLIDAFGRIAADWPRARLAIIGREENRVYATTLKEQVRTLGLAERVRFAGELTQIDLAMWMRLACVFVLPSASEGLGRVVIEAMASGTPVIGSNVGGIPEMVKDGVTGFLVRPGDDAALAERIQWVLEHPNDTFEMGCCAHSFAKRFFSSRAYANGYARVFEAAMGRSSWPHTYN